MGASVTAPNNNQNQKQRRVPRWVKIAVPAALVAVVASNTGGDWSGPEPGTAAPTTSAASAPASTGAAAPTTTAASVPAEYRNALEKAKSYSDTMHMSKKGIVKQLTSSFEGFSAAAAKYAADNVEADWNANALEKARNYQETMNMSPAAVRNQLTSSIEGFTAAEADYAIANLDN